ncbi:MAG: tetratricopeptide repeat protein [Nitrospina sp.]|nr:tetratricopeptide repeat protein [Nitrospina sp.]
MVLGFFKKAGSGKDDAGQNGPSSSEKSGVIDLEYNKKPPLYFSPFTPKNIIGRDSDINEIVQKKNQTRFLIIGDQQFKGIGKTAFSLRIAEKFASQYPEGQVYIDLKPNGRKPLSVTEVMAQVIWHFKIRCKIEDSEEKLKKTYLKALTRKKIILLLDGVTQPIEVLKLLPPKNCLMIVVSQERISLSGFYRKSMKALDPESAQKLLMSHTPKIKEKAKEIAEFCEFIPMPLCIAGGLLATSKTFSEKAFCEKLQQWAEGNLLMELIEQSYKDLEAGTAKVFRKLYVFLDGFDAKAQDFICQDKQNEHLTILVNRQLVMFNEKSGCYRLHPMIHKFLRDKITEPEMLDAEKRHATHFMIRLQGLQNEVAGKDPSSTRRSVNAFDSDWGNYQAAQEWALENLGTSDENNNLCASFPESGAQFLKWRLSPKACMEWFDAGLSATQCLKDNQAELRQLINLSEATFDSRDYGKAKELHEDSLEMALEIGDGSSATMILDKLAFFQMALNRHGRAIEYYEQALEIFKEDEDIEGQITTLIKIAATNETKGSTRDSIDFLKQALVLAEQTGSHHEQRKIFSDIGKAFFKLGKYKQAREYYEKALVIDKKFHDSYGEACDLWGISLSLEKLGGVGEAIKKGESALKIFKVEKKKEAKQVQEKVRSWKSGALSKTPTVGSSS